MRGFLSVSFALTSVVSLFACSSRSPSADPIGDGSGENPHVDGSGGTTVIDPNNPSSGGTSGTGATGGTGGDVVYETVCTPVCSDDPPPDQDPTCAQWQEWGTCGAEWFADYCQVTCGTCDSDEVVCMQVPVDGGSGGTTNNDNGDITYTNPGQTAPPLPGGAQNGFSTRYWDCCKPHCAWPGNAPETVNMCTLGNQPLSDENAVSGCEGGDPAGQSFQCWNMAPWAVSETLAYGYAATPAGGSDCGKCYQLEFTGTGHSSASDPGSQSLAGKTMIVQAINIGGDVGGGQFDLLLPGGGVGMYDGCSEQWGVDNLGETYGGFLSECGNDVGCLRDFCEEVFGSDPKFQDLYDGCLFHVVWMQGADNPNLRYAEVDCPPELESVSGMSL